MSRSTMILSIIIEGDSAEDLFAVGPEDMKEVFLPKGLNIKKSDISQIAFKKVTARDNLLGLPTESIVHQDNFYRGKS